SLRRRCRSWSAALRKLSERLPVEDADSVEIAEDERERVVSDRLDLDHLHVRGDSVNVEGPLAAPLFDALGAGAVLTKGAGSDLGGEPVAPLQRQAELIHRGIDLHGDRNFHRRLEGVPEAHDSSTSATIAAASLCEKPSRRTPSRGASLA